MPNSKQAEKRVRTDERRRLHNKAMRSSMRTAIRRVAEAVGNGDKDRAHKALATAMKRIDKCAKRNIIHRNNASRRKSLLARRVGSLG
ncbi:MAG: 30S ribosomal protein S20 [Planctomycetes bacterium]|nr:30S ribosomal protein S20 [Planctomycetota bacterium]